MLYGPAIPLPGISLDKTIIQKDTYNPMFTAALFTIAKKQKQSTCPPKDEWIKKIQCVCIYTHTHTHIYTHTTEYYSATKKNKILSFAATWMQLDIVVLNEVNQK